MRKSIVKITTEDTKKTYEFPGEGINNPQLWEVEIRINALNHGTHCYSSASATKVIHVEREAVGADKVLVGTVSPLVVGARERTMPRLTPDSERDSVAIAVAA